MKAKYKRIYNANTLIDVSNPLSSSYVRKDINLNDSMQYKVFDNNCMSRV